MASGKGIRLVSRAEETASAVAAALEDSAYSLVDVCATLSDVGAHLEESGAAAVVVDIDPEPAELLGGLELLTKRYAGTRFIVLSSTLQSELMLEAMQAGARHFLQKSALPDELDGVLNRLVPGGAAARDKDGKVVTVLSASGGSGSTTLAINLAHELYVLSNEPSLLIDLDHCYGGAATYLGVSGQFGVADVLSRNGELDPELIRSTAQNYTDGLELLISPATIDMATPAGLEYARLRGALPMCAATYAHTVVDAPRVTMSVAAQLVAASDRTLLTLQLTVKDIGTTRAMIAALRNQLAPTERITAVVNRYRKRKSMVTLDDARSALRDVDIMCISNDYTSAIKGLNYGRPLAQSAPRSTLHREIKQLAADIVGAAATTRT